MRNLITRRLFQVNSRGSVLILVAISLVVFIGIAALAIDIGHLSTTRNELQNVADAAALAGAGYLGSEYLALPPSAHPSKTFTRAEIEAVVQAVAQQNKAAGISISIDTTNTDDLTVGLWNPATKQVDANGTDPLTGPYTSPDAVQVVARRDDSQNSPISTFFAKIFGVDTMVVSAEAVAALSGPATVAPGELKMPVGLSDNVFPSDCSDFIEFSPTTESCAGWHNFEDDINASAEADKLISLIQGNDSPESCGDIDCGGEVFSDGPTWLSTIFTIPQTPDPEVTPGFSVGQTFDFQGGAIASLLTGVLLDGDYDGYDGTVIKTNGDPASNLNKPMPMMALFDYYRFRDGDDDNDVWSATIPVYKDDTVQTTDPGPECNNPHGRLEVLGFAKIKVIAPNPPPAVNLQVQVECAFSVVQGRGGGGNFGNIKGSVPNLVK